MSPRTLAYRRPSSGLGWSEFRSEWILALADCVIAALSLPLLLLAHHIYICDEREKWCHIQALIFGIPLSFVTALVVFLSIVSALTGRRRYPILLTTLLIVPVTIATIVIGL